MVCVITVARTTHKKLCLMLLQNMQRKGSPTKTRNRRRRLKPDLRQCSSGKHLVQPPALSQSSMASHNRCKGSCNWVIPGNLQSVRNSSSTDRLKFSATPMKYLTQDNLVVHRQIRRAGLSSTSIVFVTVTRLNHAKICSKSEVLTGADAGDGGASPIVKLTALLGPCCSSAASALGGGIVPPAEGEVV